MHFQRNDSENEQKLQHFYRHSRSTDFREPGNDRFDSTRDEFISLTTQSFHGQNRPFKATLGSNNFLYENRLSDDNARARPSTRMPPNKEKTRGMP